MVGISSPATSAAGPGPGGDRSPVRVMAIDGSPSGGGRTRTVLEVVLAGSVEAGAEAHLVALAGDEAEARLEGALREVGAGDAFLFGSPVYRASFASPLKAFLDRLPRGMWGETEEPIRARAVGLALTGASWHHYLAMNELRDVLAGFFAAHVLTPGLYVPAEGFTETRRLTAELEELAHAQGVALVDLARAIAGSPALSGVRPQA